MTKTALILGASRGLGLALAAEFLKRGWNVIATERSSKNSGLSELKQKNGSKLEIQSADINVPSQISALKTAVGSRRLDLLFVNAGVALGHDDRIEAVTDQDFQRVMLTNTLSPMRAITTLESLVPASGTIAVMNSGLGSVAANTEGGWEIYRGSKAALNTLMRSLVARNSADRRTYLTLAPGWVRTDMGGPGAHLSVDESIPRLTDVVLKQEGRGGLQYLNYQGETIPW